MTDIKSILPANVVFPFDPRYNQARMDYNTRFDKFPLAIVFCQSVQDVITSILVARRFNIPFRARCGRHSYEAFSLVNEGIIIDVSPLTDLHFDPSSGTATVGAGFRLLPLYEALWQHRVTIPAGTCPTVGVSGLTLGGGFGMLTRLLGMNCDSVVALDMVDANGNIVHADENNHTDLLRASCGGGGGNFGVVTSFTFKVHPINNVSIFNITWNWQDSAKVINAWQNWAPFTDERLTSIVRLFTPQTGRIISAGEFVGPAAELRPLLQPLINAAIPVQFDIFTVPYIEAVLTFGGIGPIAQRWHMTNSPPHKFKHTGAYVYRPLPAQAIQTMLNFMSIAPNPDNSVEFQALAGAVRRVPVQATGYFYRNALFNLQYKALWTNDSEETENICWVENFRNTMLPFTIGDYVNFPDISIKDFLIEYYQANVPELEDVKTIYDPGNVFHFPQSIPPLLV